MDSDRRITAAQGYVELGLHDEARAQLDSLPAELHHRPDVVELTLLCQMHAQRWPEALALAQILCALEPTQPGGFIHAGFCLHEMGRTADALETLQNGPASLRGKAVYHYNRGCYLARLERDEEALESLKQAFEMDPELRRDARRDPDLDPLRAQLGQL
jgi:tetratricopeptide (TPR) repeat protein